MKRTLITLTAIALAGSAFAHGKATGIVRDRMDGMVVLADTMKSLATMAKSDAPLDQAVLTTASRHNRSGHNQMPLINWPIS